MSTAGTSSPATAAAVLHRRVLRGPVPGRRLVRRRAADRAVSSATWSAEQVVDDGGEAELAEASGFCPANFELDDDLPAKAEVEEQQVQEVVRVADGQLVPPSDDGGEAGAESGEESAKPGDEGVLELAFAVASPGRTSPSCKGR